MSGRKPGPPKGTRYGGRGKGTPNKVTREVRALAQDLVGDSLYQGRLRQRLVEGELPAALESMLWAYAWGKPRDKVEGSGGREFIVRWLREDEELDAD